MANIHPEIVICTMQLANEWTQSYHDNKSLNPPNVRNIESYIDKRSADFRYTFEAILKAIEAKIK